MKIKQKIKNYLDPEEKGYVSPCDVLRFIKDLCWFVLWFIVIYGVLMFFGLGYYNEFLNVTTYTNNDFILIPLVGIVYLVGLILLALSCFGFILLCIILLIKVHEWGKRNIICKTKMCKIKLIKLK